MSQILQPPIAFRQSLLESVSRIPVPSLQIAAYLAVKAFKILSMTPAELMAREIKAAFSSGEEMNAAVAEHRKYHGGHSHAREIERVKRRAAET